MDKKLQQYAELIIRQGINLSPGEDLGLSCPVYCSDLGYAITKAAYEAGARKVTVFYSDERTGKLAYEYCTEEDLCEVPDWIIKSREYLLENKAAWVSIICQEPELMSDIDPDLITKRSRATRKALKFFSESTSTNATRWCLAAAPNPVWAQKIFPDLSPAEAEEKMWTYMHKTLRLDQPDPLAAWKVHQNVLEKRSKFLNDAKIKSFHYKNSIGTDFTVGMTEGYLFTGAVEKAKDGTEFTANLPTEEVFSSPHRMTANGKLVASMPLVHGGSVIENFSMTFQDGKVVDFQAEKGYEILKGIIETDEGSAYLGEIALVGYNSPIQNLKTLFFCTLYDENASCHFAIGRGFAACYKNGMNMSKEELLEKGVNDSLEHTDFMVGTPDLSITATTEDGTEIAIFRDGDWVI